MTRTIRISAAALVLVFAGCKSCKEQDAPRDGKIVVDDKPRKEIELSPLPQAPAVPVEPGTLPGIPSGPLAVVVARPQGDARADVRPALTFNKPIVALGEEGPTSALHIAPKVEGEWKWIGSSAVELVPTQLLPFATEYVVTVDAGLKAIDGSALPAPYTFRFHTDPPQLETTNPPDGWRWLPPDGKLSLTFNQPVKDLAKHLSLTVNGKPAAYDVVAIVDVEEERAQKLNRKPAPPSAWGKHTRYEIKPQPALPLGANVTLTVPAGELPGEQGPLTAAAIKKSFSVIGPMRFSAAELCTPYRYYDEEGPRCPYGPIAIKSTNEPDVESLKAHLHIEPEVEIDWDQTYTTTNMRQGAMVVLYGRFKAGTKHTITIDAGVKDAIGQTAPAFSASVTTSDLDPDLRLPTNIALIEAGGDDAFPIEGVNLNTVEATIRRLTPSQMAITLGQHDPRRWPDVPATQKTLDMTAQKNVALRKPLPLGDAFPGDAPKLFTLVLRADRLREPEPRYVHGQITDLAAHAKVGATSSVVWVTSVKKGMPVDGATVRVFDRDGRELESAQTNKDGIAKLPGVEDMLPPGKDERRYGSPFLLVSAEKDGDTGVTASWWDQGVGPGYAGVMTDWDGDTPELVQLFTSERGIYRPGEEAFVKGLVRIRRRGELRAPEVGSELEVSLRGGDKQIVKQKVKLTKFGTFSAKLKLPEGGALGWHEVVARGKLAGRDMTMTTSFRVEEYRAPKFKVDVAVDDKEIIAGERVQARVIARYLFGGALPEAPVEATAFREAMQFAPEGFDKWSFGVAVWGYDDGEPDTSNDVFGRMSGFTTADGTLLVDLGEAEPMAGRTARLTIEAEVADVSRQRVANRATLIVHPASVYAGVQFKNGFGEAGRPLPIEMIGVDVDGKRTAGTPIAAVVKRREWKNIRKRDPDTGRYNTISEPEEIEVKRCDLRSDAQAPVRCELTPEKPGLYIVEATATDERGRTSITKASTYVAGGGWVSWQRGDQDLIDLVPDQRRYAPGDTAKVLVKSPWPEAEAIVTVEREGVLSVRRVTLQGAARTLDVPIDDNSVPNVFVSVLMVRGRLPEKDAAGAPKEIDPGRPQVKAGYARLDVEKKGKRLTVDIDSGGVARPGSKVKVKLAVKDAQGRGTPAEVALWAVDEAVLRLTDYELRDPVEALHPARGLSVRLGEPLLFLVRQQTYGEKGRPPGGDGGASAGAGFRSNFKTTAFFEPALVTDASGRAEIEVTLPDDLTTYRVLALAITEGDKAGKGASEIVVQKPLMALPALPRAARVGDKFSAGVVVHAKSGGDVKVRAEVTGLKVNGAAERSVAVNAGAPREVRFDFVADTPGKAVLRFFVEGGGEKDGVQQEIPVRLPVVMETRAVSGDTVDKREEALVPPSEVWPDVGGLEVTLASTALAGYQEALTQLVEYPYGCAEQLSSRLVPFIAVRELQGGFGLLHEGGAEDQAVLKAWLGSEDVPHPDDVVKKTIAALTLLQQRDGGFTFWPTTSCVDPWATSYATLALYRAKELGYAVDDDVVARGQRFLAERIAVDKLPSCGWGPRRASAVDRAFALWVLARTGKPKTSLIAGLIDKSLPLFAKAMLSDALVIGKGDSSRAQALLQEVMNGAIETPREVHFEDPGAYFGSSDVRTTAIVLMTLVDAEPMHPFVQKIARYLGTARKGGRYRTTQEAAFALMAISELVRAKERDAPDFVAVVSLGERTLIEEDFRGRNLEVVTKTVGVDALGIDKIPFTFSKKGDGVLTYSAVLRTAPKEMPTNAVDHGIAVQRWFEPWNKPLGAGQTRAAYAGDMLRLRVRVAAPAERRFVAIDVPLPSGLEAIDASLASSARLPDVEDEEQEEYGFWTPFSYTELRDDRVVIFSDQLPPGVHAATVAVRATTPGTFVFRPAIAEEMYAPEVSGRSDGGQFEVLLP